MVERIMKLPAEARAKIRAEWGSKRTALKGPTAQPSGSVQ
jgi:hypothetical protein